MAGVISISGLASGFWSQFHGSHLTDYGSELDATSLSLESCSFHGNSNDKPLLLAERVDNETMFTFYSDEEMSVCILNVDTDYTYDYETGENSNQHVSCKNGKTQPLPLHPAVEGMLTNQDTFFLEIQEVRFQNRHFRAVVGSAVPLFHQCRYYVCPECGVTLPGERAQQGRHPGSIRIHLQWMSPQNMYYDNYVSTCKPDHNFDAGHGCPGAQASWALGRASPKLYCAPMAATWLL